MVLVQHVITVLYSFGRERVTSEWLEEPNTTKVSQACTRVHIQRIYTSGRNDPESTVLSAERSAARRSQQSQHPSLKSQPNHFTITNKPNFLTLPTEMASGAILL